jgi:hypothetical protein
MTLAAGGRERHSSASAFSHGSAEQLVGVGFRHWITGYRTGDLGCWEQAWNFYSTQLGVSNARAVMSDLAVWVRAIEASASRGIRTAPLDCAKFCRDECAAIAMIAASQHSACPALRSCAFTLLGCSMIDGVVESADSLAARLKSLDKVLSPQSIHLPAPRLAAPATLTLQ